MIRITRETDYGIVLLSFMAVMPSDEVATARDLASRACLTLPMASKILKALARAGLLVSYRGAKGGYGLARRPDEISVGDVIAALEGPIGITECASEEGACEQEPVCPARGGWRRVSQQMREFLERIPLSELMVTEQAPLIQVGAPATVEGTTGS
jgi:FeS assembly SUF system regulator